MRPTISTAALAATCGMLLGCGGSAGNTPTPPACDSTCQDSAALLAMRDTIKLLYNVTLQGSPVGPQRATQTCPGGVGPDGGAAYVTISGWATSNAKAGLTDLTDGGLTYEFHNCSYTQHDSDPKQSFQITLDGTITEVGVIAAQTTATTSLTFTSPSFSIAGSVYDPPIPYAATDCPLALTQNGNQLSGTMCTPSRVAGVGL